MLIFGHVGITTGIFKLYEAINVKNGRSNGFIDYRIVIVVYFIYKLSKNKGYVNFFKYGKL